MKRVWYVLLFMITLVLGVLMVVYGHYIDYLIPGIIYVEIAFYGTLIVFEVKNLGPEKDVIKEYETFDSPSKKKEKDKEKVEDVGKSEQNAPQNGKQSVEEEKIL